ncbi:MAG: hypothetical protein A3A96_02085 [Candidatus Zambryskibacteria bacterium RIFCSPLOWO2_01_FULL_39_39]|uniref:Uncharacterized protein n=1 Tax=Candidatus Zambryskibacteria bacterium RIFCSPLOWO2_01_FULL_39_39 TaxID=1802758 RepID=A0A1G2TWG4_9BACT|nr:MAG: hypothetical protein A2644_01025 [Candidatus Zambryskibacteria bacterium RIFCSPHIGHO2_01_FULL_39_63]OHA94535.1 MAG: hypothetical protein A3B88_01480 [Candidatus Zambryskibacteria bacterium RIFCSPHIGHO2_02_FULL_39_19]OHA97870.1 MAG: hypothetical protein A3F20_01475 [Candidatus Zambryskibacteria bacterium RIFCSPHIGHO2_12_FULL_39_21]OHB01513.1 MAG: hypothetical protein A3A96_02085 [Candidatus Zambryskibacteria bacterium RIFCSPLOWO2_01_FULL_39_39]
MDKETYELDVFCKNCDFSGKVLIPKGVSFTEHQCPKCGVVELQKKLTPARITPHIENYM